MDRYTTGTWDSASVDGIPMSCSLCGNLIRDGADYTEWEVEGARRLAHDACFVQRKLERALAEIEQEDAP